MNFDQLPWFIFEFGVSNRIKNDASNRLSVCWNDVYILCVACGRICIRLFYTKIYELFDRIRSDSIAFDRIRSNSVGFDPLLHYKVFNVFIGPNRKIDFDPLTHYLFKEVATERIQILSLETHVIYKVL